MGAAPRHARRGLRVRGRLSHVSVPDVQVLRRERRRPWVTLAFALAYLLAGLLGRQAVLDGTTFALVWPAAGVAVLWLLVQRSGPFSLDTVILGLVSFAANYATGASVGIALVLMVTNTTQTVVAVALVRRWCPTLWGAGGTRSLDSPKVTSWYLGASAGGMLTGMVLGVVGTRLNGGEVDLLQAVLWFDRNLCGVLAVTTLGLLVGHRLESPRPRPALVDSRLELVSASLFTVAVYVLAFAFHGVPLAFMLLAATVWFGVRFSTVVSASHSLVAGTVAIVLTLAERGPFAAQSSPEAGAVLAQLFVGMMLVSGVVLSTGREERRLLSEQLHASREDAEYQAGVLQAVISSVVEGLLVIDDSGRIALANPAAAQMLGYGDLSDIPANRNGLGAFTLDGVPLPDEMLPSRRALAGETLRNVDLGFVTVTGEDKIFSVSAAPLPRDTEHDRARAVILFRDATEDVAQRTELAAFAGVVAHDLRNPLAAIEGWTEMLESDAEDGEIDPQAIADYASRIRSSSARMHGLILHLLAHATSKDAELSVVRLELAESVRRIAAARDALDLVTIGSLPPVRGDRVLVDQLLDNLIGNALKYVAEGTRPDVQVDGCDEGAGWVRLTVTDNGIGLPPGEHDAVFEEFHRAHAGRYEGTGLGLSICRRIVHRHGGAIRALDGPGGTGTVFEFTLPSAT